MGPSGFVRNKVLVGLVACGTIAGVAAVAAPSAAQASASRHTLRGSTPRWLRSARELGATPSGQRISFGIVLGMRNQAGAVAQLKALSEPGSARYGDWLSNKAFDAAYAPSKTSVNAVRSWLRSQGFGVTKTLPSGMLVEATGTARQIEKTFGTSLHSYKYNGKTVRANATALSLPAGTSATVQHAISGVIG